MNTDQQHLVRTVAETATGFVVAGTPWWVSMIADANLVLQAVGSLAGAIIGLVGVGKIIQRWRHNKRTIAGGEQ